MMHFAAHIEGNENSIPIFRKTQNIAPIDLLSWLKVQPRHPKFYWRSKDASEEIACCGQLLALRSVPKFSNARDSSVTCFGFQDFFGSNTFFFLPTLEVRRKDNHFTFSQNFLSDKTPCLSFVYQKIDWKSSPSIKGSPIYTPNYEEWQHLHKEALLAISSKALEKVVLARKARFHMLDDIDSFSLFHRLCSLAENSYPYFLERKVGLAFFGASPEKLFSRRDREIQCDILAGTRKRGLTEKEDLLLQKELISNAKEQKEFQFVQNYIEKQLAPLCEYCTVSNQEIYTTQDVQHLYAKYTGQLQDFISEEKLIQALHPTPAMGGCPKREACAFLQKHDINRGLYSAPFGWISPSRAEMLIAIRCASVEGRKIDLFSGTGIVAGSDFQGEWKEHGHKIRTLKEAILGEDYQPAMV